MKTTSLAIILALTAAACGDDGNSTPIDANTGSDGSGSGSDGGTVTPQFVQIEQLARPGIAEALLLSNGFLAGYNATAPSFTGVPAGTLGMVVDEAKTVLKAIYLGTCLVNGAAGLTADNGAKPSGVPCVAVGGAIFTENNPLTGTTLTQAAKERVPHAVWHRSERRTAAVRWSQARRGRHRHDVLLSARRRPGADRPRRLAGRRHASARPRQRRRELRGQQRQSRSPGGLGDVPVLRAAALNPTAT
jgi:hypothetical protein